MHQDDLMELMGRIAKTEKLAQGQDILREALTKYGLSHVAYGAVNIPSARRNRGLIAVTYAPEWQRHYLQQGYVDLDPVVRAGIGGILPVDWSTIDRSQPAVRRFFGEAQDFKVGSNGLSFPIRGRLREFALFSITSDMPEAEWTRLKASYMREFMLLAYHFHSWALKAEGLEEDSYADKLSMREKECLRWRAIGKSDWDISQIVGISERTVKFHLENARAKLGAANTMHAVSKALTLNLITLVESV